MSRSGTGAPDRLKIPAPGSEVVTDDGEFPRDPARDPSSRVFAQFTEA